MGDDKIVQYGDQTVLQPRNALGTFEAAAIGRQKFTGLLSALLARLLQRSQQCRTRLRAMCRILTGYGVTFRPQPFDIEDLGKIDFNSAHAASAGFQWALTGPDGPVRFLGTSAITCLPAD